MLYIKGGVPRPALVVRDLARGTETTLDPAREISGTRTLDPEGNWVMTDSLAGSVWPEIAHVGRAALCRGEAASCSVFGEDRALAPPTHRVIPTAGGPPEEVPGLIRPFGPDLLVRDPDGALTVASPDGKRRRTLRPGGLSGARRPRRRQERGGGGGLLPPGSPLARALRRGQCRGPRPTNIGSDPADWRSLGARPAPIRAPRRRTLRRSDGRTIVSKPPLAPQEARRPGGANTGAGST